MISFLFKNNHTFTSEMIYWKKTSKETIVAVQTEYIGGTRDKIVIVWPEEQEEHTL